ncbi:hypothetical protein, partial [[Clostridium] innocuum]|uniref:hypothetical protein n=1 Tax=Clostridium innocuum TaxID=1522 RepID=UPI0005D2042B
QILCSDYAHDHRILAKLFARTFHDKALQWYCSLPPYSIDSFPKLANAFIQQFQNNIGPQVSLTDLMHCKQSAKEKLTEFIGRFKHLHAQISYHVPDIDIQCMFISNLQKDIRDKILLTEFTSFQQLCAVLHHYQLQVSQFESNTPMAPIPVDKSDAAPNPNKFQKFNNYVKINKQANAVADQVVVAS